MLDKQFCVRLSDDQRTALNKDFPLTPQKEILDLLLNKWNTPEQQPDNSQFLAEIEDLTDANHELNNLIVEKNADIEALTAKIAELEAREPVQVEVEKTLEVERKLNENELLFTVKEPHLSLLREQAKRLDVPEYIILVDTFIRHTVNPRDVWEYPKPILANEFEKICGYTHDQILKYLKNIDKK
jgi:hypothetical protein